MNGIDVSTFYEYQGSITQPPCTEGITWYVIPSIQNMNKKQRDYISSIWGARGNNRAIQDDNSRKVFSSNNKMLVNPMGASALFAGASAAVLAATLAF